MANLLNKCYMIMGRPFYMDGDNKVMHKGVIYASVDSNHVQLTSVNTSSDNLIGMPINSNTTARQDPWFLLEIVTSYQKLNESLKRYISEYGTANIRVSTYIPIDFTATPFE